VPGPPGTPDVPGPGRAADPGEEFPGGPAALTGELLALGVPAHIASRAAGRDPYSAIVRALAMLPAPATAPGRAGEILVVAGELRDAHEIARIAAKRMRIDPSAILVAGPSLAGTGLHASRRMSGPADAEKRAPRLHDADVPHVVVIDAPLGADNGPWAHAIAEALGANAVWAVVDATRKTADVRRHLRGLGIVDAIAVHGSAVTADPASVLGLGVPVALLDGRRATPQAWAALLCDRLTS
jgi:hypothetical protein